MSGSLNPLFGAADETAIGQQANALLPTSAPVPLAPPPSLADAWTANANAYGDFVAQQRAAGVADGTIDPDTGWPTQQAINALPQQYANSLLMGTTAPKGLGLDAAAYGVLRNMGAPEGAEDAASRANFLYNAPIKPPRPFEADYPTGAPADATGRLTADIEGRPLGASFIAGRNTLPDSGVANAGGAADGKRMALAGADEAVPPTEFNALSEAAIGTRPQAVAAGQIRGDAGQFVKTSDPTTGNALYNIYVNQGLSPAGRDIATGHELGHMVDQLSGQISTTGLSRELGQVYNTMTTGQERTRNLTRPGDLGYDAENVPREQIAAAIHAYLTNPNYLKTVAPKTAAAIRDAVNANPRLSNIIQFNSIAGLMAGGGAAAAAGSQAPSQ